MMDYYCTSTAPLTSTYLPTAALTDIIDCYPEHMTSFDSYKSPSIISRCMKIVCLMPFKLTEPLQRIGRSITHASLKRVRRLQKTKPFFMRQTPMRRLELLLPLLKNFIKETGTTFSRNKNFHMGTGATNSHTQYPRHF